LLDCGSIDSTSSPNNCSATGWGRYQAVPLEWFCPLQAAV
jgi:hypothetical protein